MSLFSQDQYMEFGIVYIIIHREKSNCFHGFTGLLTSMFIRRVYHRISSNAQTLTHTYMSMPDYVNSSLNSLRSSH